MLPPDFDLTGFLRSQNDRYVRTNSAVEAGMEGVAGYDCKGFACLYARELLKFGADIGDMKALGVETNAPVKHMVLQYKDVVLDDTQSFPTKPSDYKILVELNWVQFELYAIKIGVPLSKGVVLGSPLPPPPPPPVKRSFWQKFLAFFTPY